MSQKKENTADLRLAAQGDRGARARVIEDNMGLVGSVVRRYMGKGWEYEDLFQIGSMGLIKAVDRFDPNYGVCFSTYAVPMIMGEIKRYMRDDGMIKVSRPLKELYIKLRKARDEIMAQTGEDPAVEELASLLGVTPEEACLALEAGCAPESLENTGPDEDGDELIERISTGAEEEDLISRMDLSRALDSLTPMEKKLVTLRYFRDMTQVNIAAILGVSQVQVSRMERRVIGILREKMCG
ncbi:MAG: sigma-70 family RNA polymerase sigma factor [Clostridia bacterium]|nr:sigma-70 family RNA polymerase sigma factor [Clostridia bacterium]